VHVLGKPSDEGLIGLDSAKKLSPVLLHGFADAVIHEPRCLLRDPDVLGELHRGNALAGVGQQVNRHVPFAQGQLAVTENRLCTDGEVLLALGAVIPLAIGAPVNLVMVAMRAILAVAEPRGGEVLNAGFLIPEIIREVGQCLELEYRFHYGRMLH